MQPVEPKNEVEELISDFVNAHKRIAKECIEEGLFSNEKGADTYIQVLINDSLIKGLSEIIPNITKEVYIENKDGEEFILEEKEILDYFRLFINSELRDNFKNNKCDKINIVKFSIIVKFNEGNEEYEIRDIFEFRNIDAIKDGFFHNWSLIRVNNVSNKYIQ